MYYITQHTSIDERTIRRLEAEVPDADTQDRTDGRVGWSYYGIDAAGHAWVWTVYNGDPEPYDEQRLLEMDPDSEEGEHITAVADEIEDWDGDNATWLRDTLGSQWT